jgi:hypothetical protein
MQVTIPWRRGFLARKRHLLAHRFSTQILKIAVNQLESGASELVPKMRQASMYIRGITGEFSLMICWAKSFLLLYW